MIKEKINTIVRDIKRDPCKVFGKEPVFGILSLSFIIILYYFVFGRLVLSREFTFGGDTYFYWSFKYLILYSLKYFNSLPWWDPTSFDGFPLYYHFLSGWSNYLSPYYMPSLIIFKALSVFYDININNYIVFHQTVYVVTLNLIAIYLISRELITNRIAALLPPFIFSFSYFQLLNFHDYYALEATIAPLFYIFALTRLNNKRTKGNLILFLIFLALLFADLHNGIIMSAVFWSMLFTAFLLIFNISIIKDSYRLFSEMISSRIGKVTAVLLLLLVISGLVASWSPFYLNKGHVIVYRGGVGAQQPVNYAISGLTDNPVQIATSEIWTILVTWIPFPEIHDFLLAFNPVTHDNRYIGLATLPLIFSAFVLGLRNRYIYILFLTYFLCNAFIIYATDNIVYKILTDSSEIFRNVTNMSTIFPRGGPPLFLIFLAGIGLDKLLKTTTEKETGEQTNLLSENFLKKTFMFLFIVSCLIVIAGIMSTLSPYFSWMKRTLSHSGTYLLIFTIICWLLLVIGNRIIRGTLLVLLLIFTFTDLTSSADSHLSNRRNYPVEHIHGHSLIPYKELEIRGMTVPDNAVFKPFEYGSENMFPARYRGVYHNIDRITWGIKEWLVLATRDEAKIFLMNWYPYLEPGTNSKSGRMTRYPDFRLFSNGYYLPFEKIKELGSDKSLYYAEPLFYLHDENLVKSKNADPLETIYGEYTIKEYTPNKVVMETRSEKDSILYFLDNYDRFWSAYIDGKETKIHRANFTFKAIELPAGIHTVSWVYNPYPVKIAYSIFYLLLIGSVIMVVYLHQKGKYEKQNKKYP